MKNIAILVLFIVVHFQINAQDYNYAFVLGDQSFDIYDTLSNNNADNSRYFENDTSDLEEKKFLKEIEPHYHFDTAIIDRVNKTLEK